MFASLVASHLRAHGHTVHWAATGEQGLRLFLERAHPLVVLDGLLPDTHGYRWLERLARLRADLARDLGPRVKRIIAAVDHVLEHPGDGEVLEDARLESHRLRRAAAQRARDLLETLRERARPTSWRRSARAPTTCCPGRSTPTAWSGTCAWPRPTAGDVR